MTGFSSSSNLGSPRNARTQAARIRSPSDSRSGRTSGSPGSPSRLASALADCAISNSGVRVWCSCGSMMSTWVRSMPIQAPLPWMRPMRPRSAQARSQPSSLQSNPMQRTAPSRSAIMPLHRSANAAARSES